MTFSKSQDLGQIGERLIEKRFKIHMVPFETDPALQRMGVDGVRGCLTHEVKTRKAEAMRYWKDGPDLLIETMSVREKNVPGWIYTSTADVLFYGVLNDAQDDWLRLWQIRLSELRSWWEKADHSRYRRRIAFTEGSHSTENRVVPFTDIPRHIYQRVI